MSLSRKRPSCQQRRARAQLADAGYCRSRLSLPAALRALVASWIRFLAGDVRLRSTTCVTRRRAVARIMIAGSRLPAIPKMNCVPAWKRCPRPPRRLAMRLPRRVSRASASCFAARDRNGLRWGANFSPRNRVFAKSSPSCDELLRPLARWSLLEELSLPEERSRLAETEIAQPALFAIQVGLAALWKSWGVAPDCVIGHSVGEIAALHVAGALDLPEAIRIVFHRGRIMQRATGNGRMAAVRLSEEEAVDLVAPYGARLGIGAVNGPRSVVLSGEGAALEEVLAALQRRDVSCRLLPVNYAFHSAQMAPLRDALVTQLGDVRTSHPLISFISTVTGTSEIDRPDATYFGRNVREPVRFAAAARAMLQDCGLVVEIGPHPVLSAEIMECATPPRRRPWS